MSSSSPISKRKAPDSKVTCQIAGGPATWREKIGSMTSVSLLTTIAPSSPPGKGFGYKSHELGHHGCRWTMFEYSLPSLYEVTVLCQLRRKGDSKSRPQKTRKREGDKQEPPAKRPRSGEGGILVMQQTPRLGRPGLVIIKAMTSSRSRRQLKDFDNDQMAASFKEEEEEDYYREILGLLHGSDLADGVPSIETTPEG
ncbi:hypothetical protein OIU78_020854 [Salix suchowensis]|nr:hypothetical protein OIU78_020854 [Salix suchowensis]